MRLRSVLWIATTPLALTLLLAAPAAPAAEEAPATEPAAHTGGAAEATAEAGGHGEGTGGHGEAAGGPIVNWLDFGYQKHGRPAPFGAALFNFAILAFLVGKYGGPSMKKFVRERHLNIARALDESAALRDAAQARLDEYEAKLAALEGELETLLARARAEAEDERKRIIAEAEAQAARIRRDAEQQAVADAERARLALEREVGLAALAAAEQLIRQQTGAQDQRALFEKFVTGLESGIAAKGTPGMGHRGGVA